MRIFAVSLTILLAVGFADAAEPKGYKLLKTVSVPGDGGWDYLTVDAAGRRVYVSHGSQVDVLDADSGDVKGTIADTPGVHGIAVAPDLGRGFTSNGRSSTVTIFDLKTLKTIDTVKTGQNPDCIIYDPATKRVFTFNGGGKNATVIDAAKGTEAGTIPLDGRPEFAAADGAGNVFVNLVDKNVVLKIDAKKMTVVDTWPVAPGANPCSFAIDAKANRLFIGCRSKQLIVLDSQTGKVVAHQPIGTGVDASEFDPETGNIFCSCGDGTVAVFHADGGDKYTLVETIKTKSGAKTMALDPKTHHLFLPAVDYVAATGGGRRTMVPKSFAVLIYEK